MNEEGTEVIPTPIPKGIDLARLVGWDEHGNPILIERFANGGSMLFPLTPCCFASGKGTTNAASGVCCRACYAEVDPYFGAVLTQDDVIVEYVP
jgi:hypothetical protein